MTKLGRQSFRLTCRRTNQILFLRLVGSNLGINKEIINVLKQAVSQTPVKSHHNRDKH